MAQERTAPLQSQGEAQALASGAGLVPTLVERLEAARAEAEGALRELACARLNAALLAVPQLEAREAAATWMLQQLDAEAFHGLVDDQGASARACAVEAVLAVGYPVALQLEPDDIEYFRDAAKRRGTAGRGLSRALLAAGVGQAAALLCFLGGAAAFPGPVVAAPLESVVAAAAGLTVVVLMARLRASLRGHWTLRAAAAAASATLLIGFSPLWLLSTSGLVLVAGTLLGASAGLLAALAPRGGAPAPPARR